MINEHRKAEFKRAYADAPEDVICGFCNDNVTMFDDIGWWYLTPDVRYGSKPTCQECYNGEPGRAHIEKYGVGER